MPFAIQGLIGTLAGPEDPGHRVRRLLPRPRRGGRLARRMGLRARRDGRGDRRAARRRRGGGRARDARRAGRARARGERARGGRRAGGRATRSRARVVLSNADPLRTAALAGLPRARGLAPGRAGGQGDGAARRPARLPGLARARSPGTGTIDIGFTLEDLDGGRRRRPRRAPGRAPVDRGRLPDRQRPDARAGRAATCSRCSASASRPDVDAEAAADAAIARFAEVCPALPDRIVERLALGPRELEARFGITGGHIFHGEMLPGQLLECAPGAAALRRGRGALPGRLGRAPGRRGHRRARLPRGPRGDRGFRGVVSRMAWNVVIAGGGFGGFYAARTLERILPPHSAARHARQRRQLHALHAAAARRGRRHARAAPRRRPAARGAAQAPTCGSGASTGADPDEALRARRTRSTASARSSPTTS